VTSAPTVNREQVLAHRVRTHGLDRTARDPDDLAIVDLGVQDSPTGTAVQTLAARLPAGRTPVTIPDDWVLVWSVRGAPHYHRRSDLLGLSRALWPLDGPDAGARMGGIAPELKKAGTDPLEALHAAAEAMAGVVTAPMSKGDASTDLTKVAPAEVTAYCRGCRVVHIQDQVMRLSGLPSGTRLVPGSSPLELAPIPRWKGVPDRHDGGGLIVDGYLRVHGPATPGEVAAYIGTTQRAVKPDWPDGLAEVRVEGRKAWLSEDQLDDLLTAPPADLVRLLPRSDPWLLARDRELVVPGKAHRKVLWPMLGHPGGLLVDGEIAGAWRTKGSGRRLDVTVELFAKLPAAARTAVEEEAAVVAGVRGFDDARVSFDG
jgi:Winged helix DNA-binding domain